MGEVSVIRFVPVGQPFTVPSPTDGNAEDCMVIGFDSGYPITMPSPVGVHVKSTLPFGYAFERGWRELGHQSNDKLEVKRKLKSLVLSFNLTSDKPIDIGSMQTPDEGPEAVIQFFNHLRMTPEIAKHPRKSSTPATFSTFRLH